MIPSVSDSPKSLKKNINMSEIRFFIIWEIKRKRCLKIVIVISWRNIELKEIESHVSKKKDIEQARLCSGA